MRIQLLAGWAVVVTALAIPSAAPAQITYSYTRIAVTGGTSQFDAFYAPSVNAAGTVAFGAGLTAGGSGVFVGSGGATTTIAQTGTTFSGFSDATGAIIPAVSPTSGAVAFFATRTAAAGGGGGIFSGAGGPVTTIGQTPTFTTFNIFPAINSANTVSFDATPASGGEGVFAGNGATTTIIATTGTNFPSFAGPTAINAAGAVSFIANVTGGGQEVFIGNGTTAVPIASTGASVPSFVGPTSINGSGVVALVGNLTGGNQAVFTASTTSSATIASTGGSFTAFGNFVSIDSAGRVTFSAALSAAGGGGQGIFTGPNIATDGVIRTGISLDGSTVSSLGLSSFAVNDMGQIAFVAQLADGRQGIYLAVPVPEPGGVLTAAAAGVAGFGAIGRYRKRLRRSTV